MFKRKNILKAYLGLKNIKNNEFMTYIFKPELSFLNVFMLKLEFIDF